MQVKRVEIQRPDRIQTYEVGFYLRFEGKDEDSEIMTKEIIVEGGEITVYFSQGDPVHFVNFPFVYIK